MGEPQLGIPGVARRSRLRCVVLVLIYLTTSALIEGCSASQMCGNVMVTRKPSPVNSYGLGTPRISGGPVATPPGLRVQDDDEAWRTIVDHAAATSGGQLALTKRPTGYVLTSASGAQLVSYAIAVGTYTGAVGLIFPVVSATTSLDTIAIEGSARALHGVRAVVDLATRRLVEFTPVGIEEFVADDSASFAEIASIERACVRTGD